MVNGSNASIADAGSTASRSQNWLITEVFMERRGSIVGGIILILVGLFFLLLQFFPELINWFDIAQQWPLLIVGIGALFMLGALLGTPPLAIPGSIVGGTGLILFYQERSSDWSSWAYIWALYPIFVGLGILLMYALQGNGRKGWEEAKPPFIVGMVLFLIFWGAFRGLASLGPFWPILIILGGLWLLWQSRSREKSAGKG
jgi:hypothetical protein